MPKYLYTGGYEVGKKNEVSKNVRWGHAVTRLSLK